MSDTKIQTAAIRAAVTAERREQAELYATLTEQQWDTPSLCAGWRVREVLAHTTMPFRYSLPEVLLEVVKARDSFDRMADCRARCDAVELTSAQLLASPISTGRTGAGEPVHGCVENLLLLVCGRRVPAGRLHGPAAARFAA